MNIDLTKQWPCLVRILKAQLFVLFKLKKGLNTGIISKVIKLDSQYKIIEDVDDDESEV